jgi:hypothetical protein
MKKLIVGGLAALAIGLAGAPVAHAEGDSTFHRLLAKDFDAGGVTGEEIVDRHWELLRSQGLRACQLEDNGWGSLDVIYQLMREGPYIFDQANGIHSAAAVAYCPWHLSS